MPLIVEGKASTKMFYLLKNLLLLILVIFKLKCNNLIFSEIMVLNVSYVCLHAFSLHRESPDPDPERRTPHFCGGSVTLGPFNSQVGAFNEFPMSSSKQSSSIDKGNRVGSSISFSKHIPGVVS
jgi:hypothetical protein